MRAHYRRWRTDGKSAAIATKARCLEA